jgi:predicted ferric reductase
VGRAYDRVVMQPSATGSARGTVALTLVYAAPLVLSFEGLRELVAQGQVMRALALGTAVLGMAGFAFNIVLGARLPALHRLLGGLEALYGLHRINGRVAYSWVAAHVVLVLASRAGGSLVDGLRSLTPGAGTVVFLGTIAFAGMTAAIFATLYVRLTHESFVYVQRAFGLVFLAGAAHAFATPGLKAISFGLTLYLSALSALAVLAYVYRSVLGNLLVRRFDYVVTRADELDDAVMEIRMEPVGRRLTAKPGQFVFVTFYSDRFDARFHPVSFEARGESAVIALRPGHMRGQFHPFSLTSAPKDPHLSLVVKAVGTFTRALHALEPGAAARVEGPYGGFTYLDIGNEHQVWVAGGIGITPFLSMARSLTSDSPYVVHLLWGVNDRAQAYFAEEFVHIARSIEGFDFTLVPEDEEGFISAELIGAHHDLSAVDVLIVGPPPMERSLRSQFLEAGVPADRVHSERFAFGPRS